MGSRGRSIRLRIYFLVAIPLVTMLGLFGYVAYTSVTTWLNLDRGPDLIRATSEPLTNFVNLLQAERRAAVVYLSHPDAASLSTYQSAVMTTKNGAVQLAAALDSPGTKSSTTPAETAAIDKVSAQLGGMAPLRISVTAQKLTPLDALAAYTNIIASQGAVLLAEANSITDTTSVIQGLGLISAVNTQEDMSEQDAVLAGALASGSLTAAERVAFSQAAGRQQDDTLTYQELLTPAELKVYAGTMDGLAPTAVQDNLASVQQGVEAGLPLGALEQQGLSSPAWQAMTQTWLRASSAAGTATASAVLNANQQVAIDAKRRVWEVAIFGGVGLILTLIVTILLGRSINRRLTLLRRSALTLADEQLPDVVARLRRGESVDAAAEAPPLRVGSDEIGQVGQAIDTVRLTAIRAAVEESRLRQGVNDMFRNLARRSQSLLQRQLSVLDDMERKATDPDVLEDLFKMDHLTTRMRRHAEGLIILSGAPPGRGWSAPVKLIDVMRGAISEVEDYARVTIATQSRAALSGSAVTDVIHLLAELIENATTLSPPFTEVRVSGETVANGFAIEIEDRGLGMTPQRMAELNERLARPPEINPTNTEQLGLFVVGQLARRHGISVTLRQSPFGGTTAVALIPQRLLVEEGPAAITAGGQEAAAADGGYPPGGSYPTNGQYVATGQYAPYAPVGGYGPNGSPAPHGVYAADGSYGPDVYGSYGPDAATGPGAANGSFYQPYGANGPWMPEPGFSPSGTAAMPPDLEDVPADRDDYGVYGDYGGGYPETAAPPAPAGWQGQVGQAGPEGPGGWQGRGGAQVPDGARPGGPNIRVTGAMRRLGGAGSGSDAGAGAGPSGDFPGVRRGRHGAVEVPVVTGVPVDRPSAQTAEPFDVFTPLRRDEQRRAEPYPDPYAGASGTPPPYDQPSPGGGDSGYQGDGPGKSSGEYKGLPRRVRQANLAPQLRSSVAAGSTGDTGVPQATAASLADMRNTLSAMQRGWQEGRSQAHQDTEGSDGGE